MGTGGYSCGSPIKYRGLGMTPTPERLRADTAFGFLNASTASDRIFNPVLISNRSSNTMLRAIRNELRRSTQFVFSVAFITTSALAQLIQELLYYWSRGVISEERRVGNMT